MKNYEYLEHTADLKVLAKGKTLEEAFINAAKGGFDFMYDTDKVKHAVEKKIIISSKRLESLLYDFLEELLFLLDSEKFFFADAKDMKIIIGKADEKGNNACTLECTLLGDRAGSYATKGDIKAITYSEMKIEEGKGGATVMVVFDI